MGQGSSNPVVVLHPPVPATAGHATAIVAWLTLVAVVPIVAALLLLQLLVFGAVVVMVVVIVVVIVVVVVVLLAVNCLHSLSSLFSCLWRSGGATAAVRLLLLLLVTGNTGTSSDDSNGTFPSVSVAVGWSSSSLDGLDAAGVRLVDEAI